MLLIDMILSIVSSQDSFLDAVMSYKILFSFVSAFFIIKLNRVKELVKIVIIKALPKYMI